MAGPTELSFEAIREFMLKNGGIVRNHDLVKHFKKFLTRPESRDDARNYFKEIVNEVALIRTEDNEKYLVLKKKYRPAGFTGDFLSPTPSTSPSPSSPNYRMFTNPPLQNLTPTRQPPPYRAPPPPLGTPSPKASNPETVSLSSPPAAHNNDFEQDAPPVPPRRRSSGDKSKLEHHNNENVSKPRPLTLATDSVEMEGEQDHKISVKERMQKFNRLASESDLPKVPVANVKKKFDKDDDDSSSMTSLDPKTREWLVHAAKGEYQPLAKLAAECPRLVRTKDPTSTALHWAAKHGNENLVKLIAGTYGLDPNVRTNGGYTPCHLAMQYEHEEIFNLLVQVYAADQNLRDWSGKKPRQYQISLDTSVSADTFRKIKARKKHAEKESGFLRIGSLNVRVKRTTEAFSNYFLGQSSEKLHKSWGSADNVHQGDKKLMQPPKCGPIKKRKSKREIDFSASRSTPSTPTQLRASTISVSSIAASDQQDSDSDTAAGFGAHWQA